MSEAIHSTVPEHVYDKKISSEQWEKYFLKHLRVGRENAKTCAQICKEVGIKGDSRRYWSNMRNTSKVLLDKGYPVLSKKGKPSGYYFARNNAEIDDWIADQEKLKKGAQRSINHARRIRDNGALKIKVK